MEYRKPIVKMDKVQEKKNPVVVMCTCSGCTTHQETR